jgi:hypothetical protein
MLAAANVMPDFTRRQQLVAEDLRRLSDPCVIFEHSWLDADGVKCWAYSVGGYLDGARLGDGCTVAGEVMVVHADSRPEADYLAGVGLQDTINALNREDELYVEAHAARARLETVGALERIALATKSDADKSDAFVNDQAAIRPLIGDDIVLTVGGVEH